MFQKRSVRAVRVFAPGMVRLATLVLILAGLVLAAGAPAATKPSFTFVGDSTLAGPDSDARHLAFERPDRTVVVYDARTNRFSVHEPPERGCPYQDVGGGKLMWSCGSYPLHVVTKKLRNGRLKTIDVPPGEISGSIGDVGTYWVHGIAGDHRGGTHDAWWSLADRSYHYGAGAREVEDLDEPGLVRSLCSPLRRRDNPDLDDYFDHRPYLPYEYDGRFGLTWDGDWELDECGRDDSRELPDGAVGASLVAGRVSWMQGDKVVVYDARTRRSVRWGLAGIDPAARAAGVRLTRKKVFVATVREGEETRVRHVYAARLPSALFTR